MVTWTQLYVAATWLFIACRAVKVFPTPKSSGWIPSLTNLVVFGDSYTDESRLPYFINHNGTAPPTGFLPPASNATAGGGMTWARHVAKSTGAKLYNYAVSGAVCDNNLVNRYISVLYGPFPDVVYEVNAFVSDSTFINETTNTPFFADRDESNTIYSIWIGTNDLGVNGFLTDSNLHESSLPSFTDCIMDKFDQIYANGGRYMVLMNLAPLQLTPLYGMPQVGGLSKSSYWGEKPTNTSEISGKMKEYTKTVNSLLSYRIPYEKLIAERYPDASFAIFDTNSLITDIYNSPNDYLVAPANSTHQYFKCDPVPWGKCVRQPEGLDHYLWFDELHPGEKTNEVIAGEFVKLVQGTSSYATYW
ncbi:BgTH12-02519 [Blumeria graminis f. sp. triticale]|uniref:Bgt-5017 n=3 Tax=Blumeria graminis TaxID=34373 RepID=A0A381LF10_BLUGR|nr:hypothetical protein BGT96224_5017 [Blumeria graminis f. sp. tritici 96224]CAD6502281.1 BgTH12-02519 [Blumeria graminis f. sp. triticale]VDB86350.1 Bgt-5017 [Blumeria graminis f. sp. tritici]